MCRNRLPVGDHLPGTSLRPLLADVRADWDLPAITTHGRGNHAVRKGRWRYIRYADGSEEVYDRAADPNEWANLATRPKFRGVKQELAAHLPDVPEPAEHASLILGGRETSAVAFNDTCPRRGRMPVATCRRPLNTAHKLTKRRSSPDFRRLPMLDEGRQCLRVARTASAKQWRISSFPRAWLVRNTDRTSQWRD